MAAAERTEQHEPLSDNHRALVSATAAVAGAAATYALRKALKREQPEDDEHDQEDADDDLDAEYEDDAPEATIGSVSAPARSSAWQSASATVLPLAEHVARAAGRWTAEHSPALLRDHLIPRLIDGFDQAA